MARGISPTDERAAYLTAGLDIMHTAIQRGIDIRGFYWTAIDNYEWLHGYDLQFGIISRDRVIKLSAQILRVETTSSH